MSMSTKAKATDKPFFYTEELGLSLMLNRRTGKKLGMAKEMWGDLLSSIEEGAHPGADAAKDSKA